MRNTYNAARKNSITFVDSRIIKRPLLKKEACSLEGITTTRALLVGFFDRYLKNKKVNCK